MKALLFAVLTLLSVAGSSATRSPGASLPVQCGNAALKMTVERLEVSATYGAVRAPTGRQFAILDCAIENRIDAGLAAERGLATEYLAENLALHFHLGVNGMAGALRTDLPDLPSRPLLRELHLAKPGSKRIGTLVFEIPSATVSSAELRFLDDTSGYFGATLMGQPAEVAPALPLQRNEAVELGVFTIEDPYRGMPVPPGCRAIAVDLAGRSLWRAEGDAPGYEVGREPDAKVSRVHLLDWPETGTYLQLIADGVHAYLPEATGTLPETVRFIPEFFGGGRAVYIVPEATRSLELECHLPHASLPGKGEVSLPVLRFALQGKKTDLTASRTPGWFSLRDEMFEIEVLGCERTRTFAGENAGEGRQFVAVTLRVTNGGDGAEFFQTREQLHMIDTEDTEAEIDPVAQRGPHRPVSPLYVPASASREFVAVFKIDASIAEPRLAFRGGSFAETYALKPSR